jgi:hypothetical protein
MLAEASQQLKGLQKGNYEFCNTRNGTRSVAKEMVDFSATSSHFDSNNLPYFTYPRSL